MSFTKCLVLLLSLSASASALATPHISRNGIHHRALARAAAPVPLDVPFALPSKRSNVKRCKPRKQSASIAPATSSVANLAPKPVESASEPKPTTTTTRTPEPTTTTTRTPEPTTTTSQPHPTTTKKADPTPTPEPPKPSPEAPKPAPEASKPAPGPIGNLPSFMAGTQTGQGTFYATGLGACGIVNTDTDNIAAVSHLLFDTFPGYNGANPNQNPICGKKVRATYQGKSVTVAITDRCEGCKITDLDFSPSAFGSIADFALGRLSGVTWVWV